MSASVVKIKITVLAALQMTKQNYMNVCCNYYFYYRFQKSDFFLVLCYQRGKTFFFPAFLGFSGWYKN